MRAEYLCEIDIDLGSCGINASRVTCGGTYAVNGDIATSSGWVWKHD